jgi:tRNA G18 (ribose-2'-O)-methylase SpoU
MPISNEKYAFVLGNEVFGVKQEIIDAADTIVEIPQFGTKHSFNVSVSTGILLWDYYSKIKGKDLVSPE